MDVGLEGNESTFQQQQQRIHEMEQRVQQQQHKLLMDRLRLFQQACRHDTGDELLTLKVVDRPPSTEVKELDMVTPNERRESKPRALRLLDTRSGIQVPKSRFINTFNEDGQITRTVKASGKVEEFDFESSEITVVDAPKEGMLPIESVFRMVNGKRGPLVRRCSHALTGVNRNQATSWSVQTEVFEGEVDAERLVQVHLNGTVSWYKGAQGEKRKVRKDDLSSGTVYEYEGERGKERRVRRFETDGSMYELSGGSWEPQELVPSETDHGDGADVCPVCLEDVDIQSKDDCELLSCHHVFHRSCIAPWREELEVQRRPLSCPVCRDGGADAPDDEQQVRAQLTDEELAENNQALSALRSRHAARRLHAAAREDRDLMVHQRDELHRMDLARARVTPEERRKRAERISAAGRTAGQTTQNNGSLDPPSPSLQWKKSTDDTPTASSSASESASGAEEDAMTDIDAPATGSPAAHSSAAPDSDDEMTEKMAAAMESAPAPAADPFPTKGRGLLHLPPPVTQEEVVYTIDWHLDAGYGECTRYWATGEVDLVDALGAGSEAFRWSADRKTAWRKVNYHDSNCWVETSLEDAAAFAEKLGWLCDLEPSSGEATVAETVAASGAGSGAASSSAGAVAAEAVSGSGPSEETTDPADSTVPPAKRQKPEAQAVIHDGDDTPRAERSRAINQYKDRFDTPPPFDKKGSMNGYAIGMCSNGDGGFGAGRDFKLRNVFAQAMAPGGERDVFTYLNKNGFRVLFSPAGLKAYERCLKTVSSE